MSRTVLIVLAALAAIVVAGALAWRVFYKPTEDNGPAPRIAIVTDTLLRAAAKADQREDDRLAYFSVLRQEGAARLLAETSDSSRRDAAASSAATTESEQPQGGASGAAAFLRDTMSDELEAQISKMLTNSRRFAVMDASSVRSAIQRISSTDEKTRPQPGGEGKSTLEEVSAQVAQMTQGASQASGAATAGDTTTTYQEVDVSDRVERGDLAGAAAELEARYLLAISMREPKLTREFSVAGGAVSLRFEADPVFVYRLFDVRKNRSVLSDATQLDQPVVVETPIPGAYLTNPLTRTNFDAEVTKALRELSNKVQERVARHVVDAVLDATFPARIRTISPLVMNRGENDGVTLGEEVAVFRTSEQAQIRDGDIVIDAPETRIGAARVVSLQANSAQLEPMDGAAFSENDIVRRGLSPAAGVASAMGGTTSGARGLGREEILAGRANAGQGANLIRERIAVGRLNVVRDDSRIYGPGLQFDRALTERLASEPRIEVMSREALSQLADERAIGGARKTYERGGAGVGQAGYLVLGDVTVNVRRTADTINVAGATAREVAAHYAMVASGSLRIERLDSRVISSFEVSASAPLSGGGDARDAEAARKISVAFAEAAAKAILPRLFPIEVAAVDSGRIVINRGADIGLKPGDRLAVYALGDPIVDPTTRVQIAAGVRRKVGEVRVDDVQANVSVGSAIGDGASIATGQIAEATAPARATPRPRANAKQEAPEAAVPF